MENPEYQSSHNADMQTGDCQQMADTTPIKHTTQIRCNGLAITNQERLHDGLGTGIRQLFNYRACPHTVFGNERFPSGSIARYDSKAVSDGKSRPEDPLKCHVASIVKSTRIFEIPKGPDTAAECQTRALNDIW